MSKILLAGLLTVSSLSFAVAGTPKAKEKAKPTATCTPTATCKPNATCAPGCLPTPSCSQACH